MSFEIKEGQIFLHKNEGQAGKQPVMRGTVMIGGVAYDVALWGSKSGKDGSYSGKVQLPRTKSSDFVPQAAPPPDDGQDEIPF